MRIVDELRRLREGCQKRAGRQARPNPVGEPHSVGRALENILIKRGHEVVLAGVLGPAPPYK